VLPDRPDPALKEFVEKWEVGRAYDPAQGDGAVYMTTLDELLGARTVA